MGLGDSAGILFKIRAQDENATAELRKVTSELTTLEALSTKTGLSLGSMAGPAGLAIGAITAIGTATIGAIGVLHAFATSAAEYGSAIHDAADKTGLGAESISALKYAADTSGSSLEAITGSVAKFSTLLGQAQEGNEKAITTLNRYGITAKDTDTALSQAILTIAKMTDTTKQSAAAAALFKDRTGEILPVIKSFNGDLPALMSKLSELGLIMSDKDAAAADAFGDQMDTLHAQLAAVGRTIGTAVIPAFTNLGNTISRVLSNNKSTVESWATFVGDMFNGVVISAGRAANAIADFFANSRAFGKSPFSLTGGGGPGLGDALYGAALGAFGAAAGVGREDRLSQVGPFPWEMNKPDLGGRVTGTGGGRGGGGGKGGGGGGANKADDAKKKDLQARIEYQEGLIARLKDAYDDATEAARKAFEETGDESIFGQATLEAENTFIQGVIKARMELLDLADELGTINKETSSELRVRLQKQWDDVRELSKKVVDSHAKDNEAIKELDKKRAEDHKKLLEDILQDEIDFAAKTSDLMIEFAQREAEEVLKAEMPILENSRKRAERAAAFGRVVEALGTLARTLNKEETRIHQNRIDEIETEARERTEKAKKTAKDAQELADDIVEIEAAKNLKLEAEAGRHKKAMADIDEQTAIPVTAAPDYEFGLGRSWEDFKNGVLNDGPEVAAVLQEIGSIGVNAFEGLANALGSVVEQWVLTGETGPAVMRKILASALAAIAAEAAVRAIFELAKGFAALFLNPAEAAAHFKAAALFGAAAVAAGVTGRAIAGDAFKQQSAAATGQGSHSTSRDTKGQGQVYSSQPNRVDDMGRSKPGGLIVHKVVLEVRRDGIFQVVKHDVENNGPFRSLIVDTAAA